MNKTIKLAILMLLSCVFGFFLGQEYEQKVGIGLLIFIGASWILEIVPITVTALLVPVLAYAFGVVEAKEALSHFAAPIVFVFLGGFTLAAVLKAHKIDLVLANVLIRISKGKMMTAALSFFALSAVLSMWMSNTAAAAMLIPISISLVDKKYPKARAFFVLGTAYSANVGGLGTIIGSPPNLIASSAIDLDFLSWLSIGLPAALILFPIIVALLYFCIKPEKNVQLNDVEIDELKWNPKMTQTLIFFFSVVVLWIGSRPISSALSLTQFDSMVAVAATALAPMLGLISWKSLEKEVNWGVLILFGGGLCLSAVLSTTGTSTAVAHYIIQGFDSSQGLLLVFVSILFMACLTEVSSNTGSAAILVPLMMGVASSLDESLIRPMVVGVGLAANCAYMLPVGTPPNALAYSTGEVKQSQMIKIGLLYKIIAVPIIWFIACFELLFQ